MTKAVLEHVNITVSDPQRTADMLVDLFGWKIRWKGASQSGGSSIHVGETGSYVALYTPIDRPGARHEPAKVCGGLNHLAIVVDDLNEVETRILSAGFKTLNHGTYEPGRRFYFYDHDEIEYEVVSYADELPPLLGACFYK